MPGTALDFSGKKQGASHALWYNTRCSLCLVVLIHTLVIPDWFITIPVWMQCFLTLENKERVQHLSPVPGGQ
jgi:hypothetical protein